MMEGSLTRLETSEGWIRRYCNLKAGQLYLYQNKASFLDDQPCLSSVQVRGVRSKPGDNFGIIVDTDTTKSLYLRADSLEERSKWFAQLEASSKSNLIASVEAEERVGNPELAKQLNRSLFPNEQRNPATVVFVIEKSELLRLNDSSKFGTFLSSSSYIVYSASFDDRHVLIRKIFYWLGRQSKRDVQAIAGIRALELKQCLPSTTSAKTSTVREEEGQESDEFLGVFREKFLVLHSVSEEEEEKKSQEVVISRIRAPEMYKIRQTSVDERKAAESMMTTTGGVTGSRVASKQAKGSLKSRPATYTMMRVLISHEELISDRVVLLYSGSNSTTDNDNDDEVIYVWYGSYCGLKMKAYGLESSSHLQKDLHPSKRVPIVSVEEDSEPPEFLALLSGHAVEESRQEVIDLFRSFDGSWSVLYVVKKSEGNDEKVNVNLAVDDSNSIQAVETVSEAKSSRPNKFAIMAKKKKDDVKGIEAKPVEQDKTKPVVTTEEKNVKEPASDKNESKDKIFRNSGGLEIGIAGLSIAESMSDSNRQVFSPSFLMPEQFQKALVECEAISVEKALTPVQKLRRKGNKREVKDLPSIIRDSPPCMFKLMSSNNSYVLDCWSEVFVWSGSSCLQSIRLVALKLAESLVESHPASAAKKGSTDTYLLANRPSICGVHKIRDGFEPFLFRIKLIDWACRIQTSAQIVNAPEAFAASVSTIFRSKESLLALSKNEPIAAADGTGRLLNEKERMKSMYEAMQEDSKTQLFEMLISIMNNGKTFMGPIDSNAVINTGADLNDGNGDLVVYRVSRRGLVQVAESEIGHFQTNQSLLILLVYEEPESEQDRKKDKTDEPRKRCILYFWEGRRVSPVDYIQWKLGISKQIVPQWENLIGCRVQEVRIGQECEPAHFRRIFSPPPLNNRSQAMQYRDYMIVHDRVYRKRDVETQRVCLYAIKDSGGGFITAIQIPARISCLNSREVFVCIKILLQNDEEAAIEMGARETIWYWIGSQSQSNLQEAGARIAIRLAEFYEFPAEFDVELIHESEMEYSQHETRWSEMKSALGAESNDVATVVGHPDEPITGISGDLKYFRSVALDPLVDLDRASPRDADSVTFPRQPTMIIADCHQGKTCFQRQDFFFQRSLGDFVLAIIETEATLFVWKGKSSNEANYQAVLGAAIQYASLTELKGNKVEEIKISSSKPGHKRSQSQSEKRSELENLFSMTRKRQQVVKVILQNSETLQFCSFFPGWEDWESFNVDKKFEDPYEQRLASMKEKGTLGDIANLRGRVINSQIADKLRLADEDLMEGAKTASGTSSNSASLQGMESRDPTVRLALRRGQISGVDIVERAKKKWEERVDKKRDLKKKREEEKHRMSEIGAVDRTEAKATPERHVRTSSNIYDVLNATDVNLDDAQFSSGDGKRSLVIVKKNVVEVLSFAPISKEPPIDSQTTPSKDHRKSGSFGKTSASTQANEAAKQDDKQKTKLNDKRKSLNRELSVTSTKDDVIVAEKSTPTAISPSKASSKSLFDTVKAVIRRAKSGSVFPALDVIDKEKGDEFLVEYVRAYEAAIGELERMISDSSSTNKKPARRDSEASIGSLDFLEMEPEETSVRVRSNTASSASSSKFKEQIWEAYNAAKEVKREPTAVVGPEITPAYVPELIFPEDYPRFVPGPIAEQAPPTFETDEDFGPSFFEPRDENEAAELRREWESLQHRIQTSKSYQKNYLTDNVDFSKAMLGLWSGSAPYYAQVQSSPPVTQESRVKFILKPPRTRLCDNPPVLQPTDHPLIRPSLHCVEDAPRKPSHSYRKFERIRTKKSAA